MDIERTLEQAVFDPELADAGKDAILETVDRFVADRLETVAASIDVSDEFPTALMKEAGQLGFFALAIPEQYGGIGARLLTQFLVTERLSRSSPSFALSYSTAPDAIVSLQLAGSEALKAEYLPGIAEGNIRPALALTEPSGGSDLAAIRTTATKTGDGYSISGNKAWCTHGSIADFIIVFAKTDENSGSKGLSAFVVRKGSTGLSMDRNEKLIGLRGCPNNPVNFEEVAANASDLIGEVGQGFRLAAWTLDEARLNAAAQGLGVAYRCLKEAIAYAGQRNAFGKPIIQHQGVQFLLAELVTEMSAARALWIQAILELERGRTRRSSTFASMAKNACTAIGVRAALEAIQIFGAIGLSKEFVLERFLRDSKAFQIFDGPTQIQNMIIGRSLERDGLPF
nr:acyl-CoA dehydrogenase family protein [Mesorhizobium sp. WSM4875]